MTFSYPKPVSFFTWSPDSSKLAVSYAEDTRISLRDVSTGQTLWTVAKKLGPLTGGKDLDFGPSGETVITGSAITIGGQNTDATLSIISARTGEILQTLRDTPPLAGQNKPTSFVLSRDRTRLVTDLGHGMMGIYGTASWKLIDKFGPIIHRSFMFGGTDSPANIYRIAWIEAQNLLVVNAGDAQLQTWDLTSHRKVIDFQPAQVDVLDMRLNPKNSQLLIGASANTVRFAPAGHPPDGFMVERQDDPATLVRTWDARLGKQIRIYAGPGGSANAVDVSPDGKIVAAIKSRIIAIGTPAYLIMWDAESGAVLRQSVIGQGFLGDLGFSPDGTKLAYSIDNRVHILDMREKGYSTAQAGNGIPPSRE